MAESPTVQNYIGGTYVSNASSERFDSINPATGEVLAQIEVAGESEVAAAIASAQQGFQIWRDTPAAERGRLGGGLSSSHPGTRSSTTGRTL